MQMFKTLDLAVDDKDYAKKNRNERSEFATFFLTYISLT